MNCCGKDAQLIPRMRQYIDRNDFADQHAPLAFRRLALAAGLLLAMVSVGQAEEPPSRSRLSRWFKISRVPTKASNNAPAPAPTTPFTASDATTERVVPPAPTAHVSESEARVQLVSTTLEPTPEVVAAPSALIEQAGLAEPPPAPAMMETLTDEDGMTLEELTALADAHHPRLTVAFQRLQAAQGKAVQVGLYPNPVVATASPQWDGNESQFNGFVSQDIVTAGKLKLNVAAAQREISQARFSWQQERFYVLTDLRQKFFATLAAQKRVSILERMVLIAQRSRDTAQKLLEAGEGARGDTLLLDIELQRAEVALKNAETIFTIGKRQLAMLVAVPDLMIDRLEGDLNAVTRDYNVDDVRYAVAAVNPQANIARLEVDRTAYLLQRARVEPIPNVNIMGGYQRQVGVPAEDQGLFQVTMAIPLWNKNQGNIYSAQADLAGARADLQRVELQLGNMAADAVGTYRTATQLVEQYQNGILPKAKETFELSQSLYAQGQIDFLRLLQSQRTLLDAELARIDAQEQRLVSAAALAGLLQEDAFP